MELASPPTYQHRPNQLAETDGQNTELFIEPHKGAFLFKDVEAFAKEQGKLVTPTDHLTGLPFPILMKGSDFIGRKSNYHHHLHPEKDEELGYRADKSKVSREQLSGLACFALRYCRGQRVPKWLHSRYHSNYYGPPLPTTTKGKFTMVTLACAGVVPRQAIDLYDIDEPKLVDLSDKDHDFIRRRVYFEHAESEQRKRVTKSELGRFFAEYAISLNLAEVIPIEKIEEFLITKDRRARTELGRLMLTNMVDASVAELIPVHEIAKEEGMVRKTHRSLGNVVLKYFSQDKFHNYMDSVASRANVVLTQHLKTGTVQ